MLTIKNQEPRINNQNQDKRPGFQEPRNTKPGTKHQSD